VEEERRRNLFATNNYNIKQEKHNINVSSLQAARKAKTSMLAANIVNTLTLIQKNQ